MPCRELESQFRSFCSTFNVKIVFTIKNTQEYRSEKKYECNRTIKKAVEMNKIAIFRQLNT